MEISNYKNAVKEIKVDTDKILDRFDYSTMHKNSNKIHQIKSFTLRKKLSVIISFLLFIVLTVSIIEFNNDNMEFTITVNASGTNDAHSLSASPVTIHATNDFNDLDIINDTYGSVNFDFNLYCEGDGIESITYKLSDMEITRSNNWKAVAFFVEISPFTKSITDYKKDESVYEIWGSSEVKSIIGSSYTVDYDNQNNLDYALEINFYVDEENQYHYEAFIITVILTMTDKTTVEKTIRVIPTINDFSDRELLETYQNLDDFTKIELILE